MITKVLNWCDCIWHNTFNVLMLESEGNHCSRNIDTHISTEFNILILWYWYAFFNNGQPIKSRRGVDRKNKAWLNYDFASFFYIFKHFLYFRRWKKIFHMSLSWISLLELLTQFVLKYCAGPWGVLTSVHYKSKKNK